MPKIENEKHIRAAFMRAFPSYTPEEKPQWYENFKKDFYGGNYLWKEEKVANEMNI